MPDQILCNTGVRASTVCRTYPLVGKVHSLSPKYSLNPQMAPWVGIVAPAGTPQPAVDRLAQEMEVVMGDRAIANQFCDQQLTVMCLAKDKFANLIKADLDTWQKVVTEANIKLERGWAPSYPPASFPKADDNLHHSRMRR